MINDNFRQIERKMPNFWLFSLFWKMWLIDAGNYLKVLKTDILSFSEQKNVEIPNEAMRLQKLSWQHLLDHSKVKLFLDSKN